MREEYKLPRARVRRRSPSNATEASRPSYYALTLTGMTANLLLFALPLEAAVLLVHITVAVFILCQFLEGNKLFKNAFYAIYLLQCYADFGDYFTVTFPTAASFNDWKLETGNGKLEKWFQFPVEPVSMLRL